MSDTPEPTPEEHLNALAKMLQSAFRRAYDETEGSILAAVADAEIDAVRQALSVKDDGTETPKDTTT